MNLRKILPVILVSLLLSVTALAEEAEQAALPERVVVPEETQAESSDALFAAYVEEQFYGGGSLFSTNGSLAYEQLDADTAAFYDVVAPVIEDIAAGKVTSSVITITKQFSGSGAFDAAQAYYDSIDTTALLSALLADFPYELYWFDKTKGTTISASRSGYTNSCTLTITYSLYVAAGYSSTGAAGATTLKSSLSGVSKAVENAKGIVEDHKSLSDYAKLKAYRNEICTLVDYNNAAASSSYTGGYGDPWQMIYVFDGDDATTVVCEGYAKAFQYLCDISTFKGDVQCYSVSGDLDGGAHMLNIVTIAGKNYLVDVTNSDDDGDNADGHRYYFLVGASGSISAGYLMSFYELTSTDSGYSTSYGNPLFEYDAKTISLWGSGTDSILNISAADYAEDASGTTGSLSWALDADTGLLTISGAGAMPDYAAVAVPWRDFDSSIKKVVIEDGVTAIGSYAFSNCVSLTEIVIPYGVSSIGMGAFLRCESLAAVYYAGLEAEWGQISVNQNFNNSLTSAAITYSSTGQGSVVIVSYTTGQDGALWAAAYTSSGRMVEIAYYSPVSAGTGRITLPARDEEYRVFLLDSGHCPTGSVEILT